MSNLTIFKNNTAVATQGKRESKMSQVMAVSNNMRRIATNTNGTFRRIVNGEQMGKAIRGEFNAIIVDALPKVSRQFYAGPYDPNAKPTLPDCWSNLGDKPEAAASNKQHNNCADCPKNVKGSGQNGGRACRFQRRIALMLEGDPSGELYQFNVPGASLFGKGSGNVHPFESYVKFLQGNGEALDTVVTTIAYDLEADTMELNFAPARPVTDEEWELIQRVQATGETERFIKLTVSQADGVVEKPKAQATAAPASAWDEEDEEEEEAPAPKVTRSAEPDDEEEEEAAPVKRKAKAKEEVPVEKANLAAVVSAWADDEEDED